MSDEDQNRRTLSIDEDVAGYPLEKFTRESQRKQSDAGQVHEQAGRVPPQATDVERSVLGAMLIEREAIPSAIEVLPPDAFYDARHQIIYEAILGLFERDNPVDLVTVTEELKRRDSLDAVGGGYYLSKLTSEVASAANVEYHARIIAEKSLLRSMIETLTGLVSEAYEPGADAFEMLDQAEQEIFQISESQLRRSAQDIGSVLKDTMERLETIDGQEDAVTGVPSGFPKLDRMTSGWQPSDLVILAARPSMGKTALALSLARNAARHPEKPTGMTSY
jgi:replicative DNA helicase